jgi:hypothetical protein
MRWEECSSCLAGEKVVLAYFNLVLWRVSEIKRKASRRIVDSLKNQE